jgi:hypothetical protein
MKTLKETDFYKSTDIALVSALSCYGYQIEAIDKQNPNKAIFLIKRDEQLDNLIQQYFTHQLRVDPAGFFGFLKEVKNRLYNA